MEVAGHARKDPGPAARHRLKGLACAVLVALCLWALQVARVHCSAEHGCSRSRPAPGPAMLPRPKLSGRTPAGLGPALTGQVHPSSLHGLLHHAAPQLGLSCRVASSLHCC